MKPLDLLRAAHALAPTLQPRNPGGDPHVLARIYARSALYAAAKEARCNPPAHLLRAISDDRGDGTHVDLLARCIEREAAK